MFRKPSGNSWCNYPAVKRMVVSTFEDQNDFLKLPLNSFGLEDLEILRNNPKIIDSIAMCNR